MNQKYCHHLKIWPLLFAVILLTITIYSPSLRGPFVYDDLQHIVGNEELHNLQDIKTVLFNGSRQIRILQNVSFAVNWAISPNKTWSFKITNLLLHLINGILLFHLLKNIFPHRIFISVFSVLLFLIHPLQVQSVAYIMGRISLLQTFFFLLSLFLISRKENERPLLIFGLLVISFIAKESCLLIPLILFIYEISIKGKNFTSLNWKNTIIYFSSILLFIPIYLIFKDPTSMYLGTVGFDFYPFWEYTITQMYYYLFYLFLFFNPSYQSIIHPFPAAMSTTTMGLGILGGMAYFLSFIWAVRNLRKHPEISFFSLFFFITLIPTNGPLQMINPFAEYRLYQSNISLVLFLALAMEKLLLAISYEKLKLMIAAVLIIISSIFTFQHNLLWRDSFLLYRYALVSYPNSSYLHIGVGFEYETQKRLDNAKEHYMRAIKLVESESYKTFMPVFHLARVYYLMGKYDDAFKTLNQIPIHSLKYGNPAIEYYKLKLQILRNVDKTEKKEVFNKTLQEAVKVHGLEPFAYIAEMFSRKPRFEKSGIKSEQKN